MLVGRMVRKVYAKLQAKIPSGYRDIALIVLARKTLTKIRTDGRTDGQTDGQTDRQMDKRH